MSWVRLDVDTPIDERLFGSGFALYWPAVLTRAKKGGGTVSRLAAQPKQLAALWGSTVEEWAAAIAYFVEVGLLVPRPNGDYEVDGWTRTQVDPTNADRQKRHRSRESAPTSHDKTVTPALRGNEPTVTRPLLPPDSTVTTYIQTDIQTGHTVAADAATTRAHAPAREEAAAATTTPKIDDQFSRVAERWRLALRGKTGAAPLVVGALDIDALSAAVAERGADYVMKCIDRSAEVAGGGGPSLSLLRMILRDGVHEPKPANSGQNRTNSGQSRSKSDKAGSSSKSRMEGYSQAWSEDVEASRALGGVRVTKVPGVGYVPTAELTAEQIAAVEAEGFAVI